jgi:hypothetical protein
VDRKKQNTVLKTQDINDRFRNNSTWWDLKAMVQMEVNYWADKRGLEGSNKPVSIEWLATIGIPSKTTSTIRVKDEDTWGKILTRLRIDDKDSKGKLGRKVYIACFFKCYDRELSPPPKSDKKAGKSVQKRPSRVLCLLMEEEEDDSFQSAGSEDKEIEEISTLLASSSKASRPSATKNQLKAKHTSERQESKQGRTRAEIFCVHQ